MTARAAIYWACLIFFVIVLFISGSKSGGTLCHYNLGEALHRACKLDLEHL